MPVKDLYNITCREKCSWWHWLCEGAEITMKMPNVHSFTALLCIQGWVRRYRELQKLISLYKSTPVFLMITVC